MQRTTFHCNDAQFMRDYIKGLKDQGKEVYLINSTTHKFAIAYYI